MKKRVVVYGLILISFLSLFLYNNYINNETRLDNQEIIIEQQWDTSYYKLKAYFTRPSYDYLKSLTVVIVRKSLKDKKHIDIGTGIVLKKTKTSTYILTNNHVCGNEKDECFVITTNKYKAKLIKTDGKLFDLSLLKVNNVLNKNSIKGLASIYFQDRVYSVGHYLADFYTYTEGTMAGLQGLSYVMNLPCLYGCSGSGVFDKWGNLVGLIYAVNAPNNHFDSSKALVIPSIGIWIFLEGVTYD